MSLRTRIAMLVAATVLAASVIGGIGVALSSRQVGLDRLDQELRADANPLIETTRDSSAAGAPAFPAQLAVALELRQRTCDDSPDIRDIPDDPDIDQATDIGQGAPERRIGRGDRRSRFLPEFSSTIQVIWSDGDVASGCQTLPIDETEVLIAQRGTGETFRTVSIDGSRYRTLTVGLPEVGAVQFARDLALTEDTLRGLLIRIIGFGAGGALLAALIGWFFVRRTTEPIETLNSAARRVATTQDLGERISVQGSGEISALATSFNTMLESLDRSREQQQRLVQDASHELRTPLTSMRTNVELLQRHQDIDRDVRSHVLADINAELAELTELTSELVDSATEVRTNVEHAAPCDLSQIVTDCVERGTRRHHREIALDIADGGDFVTLGDPTLIARALSNLINNAAKFAPPDSPIKVTLHETTVRVLDRGPGIATSDLPHIFDRFYRATSARAEPGSGLGLAIVKQIVDAHGGNLHAANREGAGLEIGFSLPPFSPQEAIP